jgi:hypothetical protein
MRPFSLLKRLLFECINTWANLEACGGCPGSQKEDGTPSGVDCTALPNVDVVSCVEGACAIGMSSTDIQSRIPLTFVLSLSQNRASKDMSLQPRIPLVWRFDVGGIGD